VERKATTNIKTIEVRVEFEKDWTTGSDRGRIASEQERESERERERERDKEEESRRGTRNTRCSLLQSPLSFQNRAQCGHICQCPSFHLVWCAQVDGASKQVPVNVVWEINWAMTRVTSA